MTCDRPGELKGNKRQQNVKKRTVNEKRIELNQGKEMDKNRGTKRIISQTSGREAEKEGTNGKTVIISVRKSDYIGLAGA